MKKCILLITKIFAIILPIVSIAVVVCFDLGKNFDSFGKQENGEMVWPNIWYLVLILYKLSVYILPSFILAISSLYDNKDFVLGNTRRRYFYYVIKNLFIWFLVLLSIKLCFNTFLEVDRIFGIQIFNSIEDIQTLTGFIITFILKKNFKIESKLPENDKIEDLLK